MAVEFDRNNAETRIGFLYTDPDGVEYEGEAVYRTFPGPDDAVDLEPEIDWNGHLPGNIVEAEKEVLDAFRND